MLVHHWNLYDRLYILILPPKGFLDIDDTVIRFKTWNGAGFWYTELSHQSEPDGQKNHIVGGNA